MSTFSPFNNLGKTGKAGLAGLGIVGALAGWIAAYAMHWGPLAYSDSVAYLEVAHNILAGLGPIEIKGSGRIEQLITHPPFYSYVLALLSITGQPLVISARILNIALFALFIFGVGFGFFILTRRALLAVMISLFLLSVPVMMINFTSAMSEPTFFFLGFLGLFLVLFYFRTHRSVLLWVAAIWMGLSFLSRFTGAVMMAAAALAILFFSEKPILKRVLDIMVFSVLCLIPFAIYRVYLATIGGSLGTYGIPPFATLATLFKSGFRTLTEIVIRWLPWGRSLAVRFPNHHGALLIALALATVAVPLLALYRQGKAALPATWRKPNFQVGVTFAVLNLIYIVFVLATFLFVQNPKPILDERVFSPLLVGGILSAAGMADFILETALPSTLRQAILAGVVLLFIIPNLSPTQSYIQTMRSSGIGYTSQAWQESPTIQAAQKLPANVHIISDNIDAIMFYTYRAASRIPELESKTPQPIGQAFGDDPNDVVQSMFRSGQAVLVLFNQSYTQFDAIYGGQATRTRVKAFTHGLYPYFQGSDGAIYYYSNPDDPR